MPKEDIFSKINLRDYNSILENILEQKVFSEDVKNLLLSMFYKIENAYQDYKTVKVDVNQKNYLLNKIIEIIKYECKEIELIKPMSKEAKILEDNGTNFIVSSGKIICYPNERIMLEALVTMGLNDIELDEKYVMYKNSILEILYKGSRMNITEVLRDFNGWSWDVTVSQMENKNINLIYQNLIILLGRKILQNWITGEEKEEIEETQLPNNEILRSKYNSSFGMTNEEIQQNNEIDYIEIAKRKLINDYGEKDATEFIEQIKKVILAIGYNSNEEQKKMILKKKEEIENKLKIMQDNKTFLEDISKKKKDITNKIKSIDKLLANEELLKKEYEIRNRDLPNKEKIFSVSHLRIMLENERKNGLERIKQYNKKMEPKEFVKLKSEIEKNNDFFKDLDIKNNAKINEEKQIDKLQICFLKCFIKKIENAKTKTEIKDLIYELRYYEMIPYRNTIISNISIKKLNELIDEAEKIIIEKACKEKIFTTITRNKELNKKILENQFTSRIINLENINYILKFHKGILKIEIYDININDEIKQIEITENVELEVKLGKRIKLWN